MELRAIIFILVLVSFTSSSPHGYGHDGAFANSGAVAGAIAIPGLGPVLSGSGSGSFSSSNSFAKSSSASFSSSSSESFGFNGELGYGTDNHNPHGDDENYQSGAKQGVSSAQPQSSQIASGAFAGSAAFSGAASLHGNPGISQQPSCTGNCNGKPATTDCKGPQCSSSQKKCSSGSCQHKNSETTSYSNPKPNENDYSTLSPYDTPNGATSSGTPLRPPQSNDSNDYSQVIPLGSQGQPDNIPFSACGPSGCENAPAKNIPQNSSPNYKGSSPTYSNVPCGPQGCNGQPSITLKTLIYSYTPTAYNTNRCGPEGCSSPKNEPVNSPDSQYSSECGPKGCESIYPQVQPPKSVPTNACGSKGCGSENSEISKSPDTQSPTNCGQRGCGEPSSYKPIQPAVEYPTNNCGPQGCHMQSSSSPQNEPVNPPDSQYTNECGPQGCDFSIYPQVQPPKSVPSSSCGSKGCGFENSEISKSPDTQSPTNCGQRGCGEPSSYKPIQPAVEYPTNNCGPQGCHMQPLSETTQPLLKNCGPNGCNVPSKNAPVKPSTDFNKCGPQGCSDNSNSYTPLQSPTDLSSTKCGSQGCGSSEEYSGSYSPIYASSVCGPQGCKTMNSYDSHIPSPGINYPPLSPQPTSCGSQRCNVPSKPRKQEPSSSCGPQGCNSKPDVGPPFPNKPNQLPVPNYGSASTGTTIITYTGGFGGPPGLLKPNDFSIPSNPSGYQSHPGKPTHGSYPINPSADYSPPITQNDYNTPASPASSTSLPTSAAFPKPQNSKPNGFSYAGQNTALSGTAVVVGAGTYTGGFGGPPGILKPNDYSFHSPKTGTLNKDLNIVIKGFESAPNQSPHIQNFPNQNDGNKADSGSNYRPGLSSISEDTITLQPAFNIKQKHNEIPSGCNGGCGSSPYDDKTQYGYGAGHGYGGGIGSGLSFSIGGGLSKAGILNHFAGKVNHANDIAKTIVGSLANAATGAVSSGVNSGSGAYGVSGSFASSGAYAGAGTKGYGGYH